MDKPVFVSEEIEPTMALIMGRLFARVQWEQEHGDRWRVEHECALMWHAAQAIESLSIALENTTHFSLAVSNNVRACADVIEHITGHRPD